MTYYIFEQLGVKVSEGGNMMRKGLRGVIRVPHLGSYYLFFIFHFVS